LKKQVSFDIHCPDCNREIDYILLPCPSCGKDFGSEQDSEEELKSEIKRLKELIVLLIKQAGGEVKLSKKMYEEGIDNYVLCTYEDFETRDRVYKVSSTKELNL